MDKATLSPPPVGDTQAFFNLQESLLLLGEEAAEFGNAEVLDAVYGSFSQLLDYNLSERYFSGDTSFGNYITMKLALLNDSLSIADPRFTPEQKFETIQSFKTIKVNDYLVNGELVTFYTRIVDYFIEQENYKDAELYILICLANTTNQKGLFANDIVKLLSRLFIVQAHFGKRQNLVHIANIFEEIITKFPWQENLGSNINSYSMLMTSAVELGYFDYANNLQSVIGKMEENGVNIPETARFSIASNDLIMKAWSGADVKNKYFHSELPKEYLDYPPVMHMLNALEVFGKVNASNKITELDIEKLQKAATFTPKNYEIFEKIASLEFHAQQKNFVDYKSNLTALKEIYFQYQKDRISYFDYDKRPGFIHEQLKKTIFRTAVSIFKDQIPEDVSNLILEIVTPVSSEADLQIKAKNKTISVPNLIKSPQVGLKLRKEFDHSLVFLLEAMRENYFAFAKNNFVAPESVKSADLSFSFVRMMNGLKYRDQSSISSDDLFEIIKPEPIDVASIKTSLHEGQVLLTYQVVENLIFVCHLSSYDTDCKIKQLKRSLSDDAQSLRNALLASDKTKIFEHSAQTELYKIFFGDFKIESVNQLKLNVLPTHLGLPFNLLKNDKKGSVEIGLLWGIELIPSLIVRNTLNSDNDFKGKYFGIGDPKFKVSKDSETEMASLFTVRSAAMANDLSELSPLPDTRVEILQSASNFSPSLSKTLLNEEASELNLRLNSVQNYQFVHFATHGLVSGEFEGLRSPGLALSVNPNQINAMNDGYLDIFEISEMEFKTDVVVLSACRTVSDLGNPNAGFSGLTGAFLSAGVRGVIGTQWEIESVSASKIISSFFELLSHDKPQRPSIVLKQVMNEAISLGYSHPYYWSPFIHVSALTNQLEKQDENIFQNRIEIFSHYEDDQRLEFTGLNVFERELWGTYWVSKFSGNGLAKNYIFKFDGENLISIETAFGSINIIEQNHNRLLFSATYKNKGITLPGIFELNKKTNEITRLLDFEQKVFNEEVMIITGLIPITGGYLVSLSGYSDAFTDDIKETISSLIKLNNKFEIVQSVPITDESFGEWSLKKAMLISDNRPYFAVTRFPKYDSEYRFDKNNYLCDSYSTDFYAISDDLKFYKKQSIKGELLNVDGGGPNSFLTMVDKCTGISKLFTLNEEDSFIFPNYAATARSSKLIKINEQQFLIGDGDYTSSYLDQMLNTMSSSNENAMNDFLVNRDYIISEDTSSFLFVAPIEENSLNKQLSVVTSRMLSFVNEAVSYEGDLIMSGTIDRDRAFLWRIPLMSPK